MKYEWYRNLGEHWFFLPINPQPWAVGDISVGKNSGKLFGRMSPNINLVAYQQAIKEEFGDFEPESAGIPQENISLEFYFWRKLDRYIDAGDRVRQRNQADATNMQKALEDALQGVLFKNDRNVTKITSLAVDQSPHIEGQIYICVTQPSITYELNNRVPEKFRDTVSKWWQTKDQPLKAKNKWATEDEELF